MPVVALIGAFVALAIGAAGLLYSVREHRTPRELRGDWWTGFEREFRAYAQRSARANRDRRRQRGETG
jgi:hypothetical protein